MVGERGPGAVGGSAPADGPDRAGTEARGDRPVTAIAPTAPDVAVVALVVAVGVALRFWTTSPLWLDEALSANIAALPIGDVGDALRQDGHPPLYYWLLHAWTAVVGDGDLAVRSLSGIASVAALPLAWVAGRRRAGRAGGLGALLVVAVAPWCVRYGTEARMYSLAFTLVLLAWLLAEDLLGRRCAVDDADAGAGTGAVGGTAWRWAALAACTGAAVLTHYWALYAGAAAVVLLAAAWWRGDGPRRRRCALVASALAAGAVAFVPWLPAFADQLADTGTPWASASRPTRAVLELAGGLGGGERYAEAVLLGVLLGLLAVVAVGLRSARPGDRTIVVDLATVPGVRAEVAFVLMTAGLGLAAGLVADAVFVARYAAVFLPAVLVAGGVGLARLPAPWPRRVVAVAVVGLALVPWYANVRDDRTQGAEIAAAIASRVAPGDVVVLCPDQLGPATLRALPDDVRAVGLPTFERPERIDWRDYEARNTAADPAAAVARILDEVGDGAVWLVVSTGYRTYEGYCDAVIGGLAFARPGPELVVASGAGRVFEPADLFRFPGS